MIKTILLKVILIAIITFFISSCSCKKSDSSNDEAKEADKKEEQKSENSPPPPPNKNAFYENTYHGGKGETQRMEKLIKDGIVLDSENVKLEAFPASYNQVFDIPSKTALNLIAGLEKTKIIRSGGKNYLQVGIQAIKTETAVRPPINITLCVDQSGSMNSENKMEYAKKSAIDIVNRLNAQDYFSIVAYSDSASAIIPSQKVLDKESIIKKINQIFCMQSTNLHEGLEYAYKEAKKHITKDSVNLVILFSDGLANKGIVDKDIINNLSIENFKNDIQTTTIGMGIQFDEKLMSSIAKSGKGSYHFIKEASDITEIINKELEDLTHVVAQALRLNIKLNDKVNLVRVLGSNVLEVSQLKKEKEVEKSLDKRINEELGIKQDREKIQDEEGIKFLIPNFFMGDSHIVLIEIEIPPIQGNQLFVADVSLKYKDLVFNQNQDVNQKINIEAVDDKNLMLASISKPVKKNVLGAYVGETLIKASSFINEGRMEEALKYIDENMKLLNEASNRWEDSDLEKDANLLSQYYNVIYNLASKSFDEQTRIYLSKSLNYLGNRRF